MRQLKILSVVGARPQFIKAAALSRAFRKREIGEIMVHTGQHYDQGMSDIFFAELDIPSPDYHLGINSGGHGDMTGRMLCALEPVMAEQKPDAVVVYGDTNSTLAAALCAAKLRIPVAHVEAGLRSFDRAMPEEVNRVVTDHLSEILLCPTRAALANLAAEGIEKGVHKVGDVMYDIALHSAKEAESRSDILDRLALLPRSYAVATVHRAENTETPQALAKVMNWLAERSQDIAVLLPLHPRTRQAISSTQISVGGVRLIEPLGYLDMTRLVSNAAAVFTDSGGLQKEAYFHRVPCVTLRSSTEWVETIEAGWNRLWNQAHYRQPRREIDEYGSGNSAQMIAEILQQYFR